MHAYSIAVRNRRFDAQPPPGTPHGRYTDPRGSKSAAMGPRRTPSRCFPSRSPSSSPSAIRSCTPASATPAITIGLSKSCSLHSMARTSSPSRASHSSVRKGAMRTSPPERSIARSRTTTHSTWWKSSSASSKLELEPAKDGWDVDSDVRAEGAVQCDLPHATAGEANAEPHSRTLVGHGEY